MKPFLPSFAEASCVRIAGTRLFRTVVIGAILTTALICAAESIPDLARQIANAMSQSPSGKAGQRFVHAKGIVCEGIFEPTSQAAFTRSMSSLTR